MWSSTSSPLPSLVCPEGLHHVHLSNPTPPFRTVTSSAHMASTTEARRVWESWNLDLNLDSDIICGCSLTSLNFCCFNWTVRTTVPTYNCREA